MSTLPITAPSNVTSAPGVSGWMKRHPLTAFVAFAYGFTWIPVALVLLALQLGLLPSDSPLTGVVGQLISFGPAVAALIVTSLVAGRIGVGQLLRRLVQWRVGLQWYLIVLLGVPLVLVAGASILFGGAPLRASADQWQSILVRYVPFVVLTAVTTGLGEETGWRGFALARLQGKYGALIGTLILGLVWGLWHLPNVILNRWNLPTLGLFLLETMLDGFVLTWVFNNTRGSLLLAMLLHATQNTSAHVLSTLMPSMTPDQLYLVYIVTDGVFVLLLAIVTRGRLGYQSTREPEMAASAQQR